MCAFICCMHVFIDTYMYKYIKEVALAHMFVGADKSKIFNLEILENDDDVP